MDGRNVYKSLELLKEADPEFHKKIRIVDCNYDKSGVKERIDEIKMETAEISKWAGMKCLSIFEKHMLIIEKLKGFYEEYEEAPKIEGIRPNEKRLAIWMCNCRRKKKNNKLDAALENKINEYLPWFSWNPFNDAHIKALQLTIAFYNEFKEAPKQRGKRLNEKICANWIGDRRKDKKKGILDPELEKKIIEKIPWCSLSSITLVCQTDDKNIIDIKQFHNKHNKTPSCAGKISNEKILGTVISKWRHKKRMVY